MKFTVVIETITLIEVEANSEEQAISKVKNQLDAQDPRNNAIIKIAREINML